MTEKNLPSQSSPRPNQPTNEPCDDPKPEPPPPKKDPCDCNDSTPCPEGKPCPQPPKPPCPPPDPCDEGTPPAESEPSPSDQEPTAETPPSYNPAAHLAALKKRLEDEQNQLQKLEPLKTSMADTAQRIQALEKAVEGQATAASAYKEFYRTTEVALNETNCFIPTVRCQLELTEKQKKCICKAIETIDAKVKKAKKESADQNALAQSIEKQSARASTTLEWTRQWYEFLKTGLQQQVAKQRDDLKALKALADPAKDQCEVWFYLCEMERIMKACRDTDAACWKADLSVGTFLQCWRWECYELGWNRAVVEFNTAEAEDKILKTKLDQARKRAAELDKTAKEADGKRREWILKEIKALDCCGPGSKCP